MVTMIMELALKGLMPVTSLEPDPLQFSDFLIMVVS